MSIDPISSVAIGQGIRLLVNSLYGLVTGSLRGAAGKVGSADVIASVQKRAESITRVKTILSQDEEVELASFYCLQSIKYQDTKTKVSTVNALPYTGNFVLRGIAGQGKSIFFRYLAARCLTEGKTLPIFVELRRLQGADSLEDLIVKELKGLALPPTIETLGLLQKKHEVLLLLDGFDEVPEGKQIVTLHYIENLARDYTRMKIGVSARPNAPITSSSHFRVMDLCFLDKGDYKAHVKKLAPDETAKEIFAGVQKSGIVHLLNTPLMVVLLVMRFKIDATVPENELAFYDDLFDLLARRHDKTKEGFRRERRSGKSDFALRRLLSGICYLAKKEALLEFHRTKLIDWAERIARSTLMQVDGELAIDDIANVTCLLLEEGGIYTYAHNTIREFFAAGFIKDSAQAPKFYGNCVEGWIDWAQVLSYLSLLDPLRFQKHFHLRHLQWLFSGDADTDLSRLSFNDRMTNFHRLHHLKILYDEHKKSVLRYRAFCKTPVFGAEHNYAFVFIHEALAMHERLSTNVDEFNILTDKEPSKRDIKTERILDPQPSSIAASYFDPATVVLHPSVLQHVLKLDEKFMEDYERLKRKLEEASDECGLFEF